MEVQTATRTRLTLDIEPELLRNLKVEAVRRDETLKEYVTELILAAREDINSE